MKRFSWEELEKNILIKNLDHSSFYEHATAIPQDFYSFFNTSIQNEKIINLTLINGNKKFSASIKTKIKPNKKKYIVWDDTFSILLKEEFENWKNIEPHEKTINYKLAFLKTDDPNIYLIFIGSTSDNIKESSEFMKINKRKDINETEKLRLKKSRVGQGLYRNNLMKIESKCRVTGLADSNYLIASHIKPWSHSNDNEKLDGNNGLLLSPHIDQLFDSGYISFSNNGSMIISPKINSDALSMWKINKDLNIGGFNHQQEEYLEYHRSNILKG